jgi:hypothetical protein
VADKPQDQQTEPTEPQEPETDQEAFWTRFKEETSKVVDARLAERDKQRGENAKRRSATKRTTVPGLIADLMFGPDK